MIVRVGCGANPNNILQCDLLIAEKVGRFASTFLQRFLVLFYFSLSKLVWIPEECLTISRDYLQHPFCFSLLKLVLTSGGIAHHFFCFIFHHQKTVWLPEGYPHQFGKFLPLLITFFQIDFSSSKFYILIF